MITKKDKVAVAIFVIACVAIFVVAVGTLWIGRSLKPMKRYTIVTSSSVSGLNKSAAVNYLGVNVGKVESMEFGTGQVKLTIAVEKNTPITKDTRAQLTPQGITGIQFIELQPGKDATPLEEGSEITFAPSSFQEIIAKVDRVAGTVDVFLGENRQKISDVIGHANEFLVTSTAAVVSGQGSLERVSTRIDGLLEEDRAAIKETLENLRGLTKDVQALVKRLEDRRLADELADTLATAKKTLRNVDRALTGPESTPTNLGETIADLRSTARAASEAASAARDALQRIGPRADDDLAAIKATLEQVNRTVRGLEELSRELKGRPSLLVRDLEQRRREIPDK